VIDVAAELLLVPFPALFLQHLATELDGVAAPGGVEEGGCGSRQLFPVAVKLPALLGADERLQAGIAPEVVLVAIRNQWKVIPEVAVPGLEVQLVGQRGVPFTLVHPAA
jgi:hypothetical protein